MPVTALSDAPPLACSQLRPKLPSDDPGRRSVGRQTARRQSTENWRGRQWTDDGAAADRRRAFETPWRQLSRELMFLISGEIHIYSPITEKVQTILIKDKEERVQR
mgnify:CR=1 FL=1